MNSIDVTRYKLIEIRGHECAIILRKDAVEIGFGLPAVAGVRLTVSKGNTG
jgi:hypothetical protein